MYLTGQHNVVPSSDSRLIDGITHVILAFMRSDVFNSEDASPEFPLFTTVKETRRHFTAETKVMIATGGWGDSLGFEEASRNATSREKWCSNVKRMIDMTGADGVDIDWEYPGAVLTSNVPSGNRDDYKIIPNEKRRWEIEAYVELLSDLRKAIGRHKLLSIAVPGLERDMMAFSAETVPRLVQVVDFINVMTYDLLNRRDVQVKHHSGVVASLDSIQTYMARGAPSQMLNLGLGYYVKWALTEKCDAGQILECRTQLLEDPNSGADLGRTAGFSWHDQVPPDLEPSFARALADGHYFEDGSFGYWDAAELRWWTFDTEKVILSKLRTIVGPLRLGGVFAWGLGEDAPAFRHLSATFDGLKELRNTEGKRDELLAVISQVTTASPRPSTHVELGPRPYYLVNNMTDGPLRSQLESCKEKEMRPSKFSIGHRGGACLQFPEHSQESTMAGARMGVGVLECDVTFTKDLQLVCRHSQCDLHTTTNIVSIAALNAKCTKPFIPAANGKPASAKCCTSDITLAEYKSLCAKMDGFNASATNAHDFLSGTPSWRTDLYATCGKTVHLTEHIAMVEKLGLHHTPELKVPEVTMPFTGPNNSTYTYERFAQQMIDAYKTARVPPSRVIAQTFDHSIMRFWLLREPEFAKTAILLDQTADEGFGTMAQAIDNLAVYAQEGVQTMAPPLHYLVETRNKTIVPSAYAKRASQLGLKLITWSLERSGPLAAVHSRGDYYYGTIQDAVTKDGDLYTYVDVLARQVGVVGMFSDWSATVTFYANCFGIGLM
uniref:chitinase n=1 Tax=Hypocrella siamensis TaxID=696354 RepID=A0A0P0CNI4_9HYPO